MEEGILKLIKKYELECFGNKNYVVPSDVAKLYEGVHETDLRKRLEKKFPGGFVIEHVVPRGGRVSLQVNGHGNKKINLETLGYELVDGKFVLKDSAQ